jgi:mono/diheme cytochrome c family protein
LTPRSLDCDAGLERGASVAPVRRSAQTVVCWLLEDDDPMPDPTVPWRVGVRRPRALALYSPAAEPGGVFSQLARWFAVAGMVASICGCASAADRAASVARGEALAEQLCSSCHGMGPTGASSFPDAPNFRDMRFDYNAMSYQRSLANWHLGRVGMPPTEISLEQMADIGAYVSSLKTSGRR